MIIRVRESEGLFELAAEPAARVSWLEMLVLLSFAGLLDRTAALAATDHLLGEGGASPPRRSEGRRRPRA
jgi:hypothetical protein